MEESINNPVSTNDVVISGIPGDVNNLADIIGTAYNFREHNPSSLSPLTLAFIGDTIFDLIVRTKVVLKGNAPVNRLHRYASSIVNATTQSAIIHSLIPELTDEELSIYKRGRNAKSHTTAKNANVNDYKAATGFEALLGWLYLKGSFDRILELVLPIIPQYEHTS